MSMEFPDIVPLLFVVPAVAVYGVFLAAALLLIFFTHKKEWRLARRSEKHRKKAERIRLKGCEDRESLALSCQRGNMKELAALVKDQLKGRRASIELGTYHQTMLFVKQSVSELDFDDLYAVHALLSRADEERVSVELDKFLQRELEYGHLGKHREVHFQDILHGQGGVGRVAESQPAGAGQAQA